MRSYPAPRARRRPADTLLAGGTIPPAALATMCEAEPAAIFATARAGSAGGIWQGAARTVGSHWRPVALQRAFERHAIADATALFLTGDPLAIDVPLAFTTATQVEAQNLRLLGEAAVRGIAAEVVRDELLWPDGRA